MANHPLSLALRFVLELAGLFAYGAWGARLGSGPLRYVWMILIPLAAALAWGVFRVPGDGGRPVVQVPGVARLLLEAVFFGGATWAFAAAGLGQAAWIFGVVVVLHYLVSLERLRWLVRQ